MKTLNVRMDEPTHDLLARQAQSYARSLNGQIQWLITSEGDPDVVQHIELPREVYRTIQALLDDHERFSLALEVCSHVLHRQDPPDSWRHAAEMASSAAHNTFWTITSVDEDDPELRRLAEQAVMGS